MKYATLLVFTLLLFLASPVAQEQAPVNDGNDLLPRCKAFVDTSDNSRWGSTHEAFSVGFCMGLVEGVASASPHVCPVKGVTNLQSARVVLKYLEDNPQSLNLNEAVLTELALSKAFPCPK